MGWEWRREEETKGKGELGDEGGGGCGGGLVGSERKYREKEEKEKGEGGGEDRAWETGRCNLSGWMDYTSKGYIGDGIISKVVLVVENEVANFGFTFDDSNFSDVGESRSRGRDSRWLSGSWPRGGWVLKYQWEVAKLAENCLRQLTWLSSQFLDLFSLPQLAGKLDINAYILDLSMDFCKTRNSAFPEEA
ncbi:hypothetical protein Droror1_Dr00012068 [Drosera rotundifolia]